MGFWKRLFGKKNREQRDDDWEEVVYERDRIDFHDTKERNRYLIGCLEQMGEAEKEINLLSGEYGLVTSYLTDMEEIEALPNLQSEEIKVIARKLQNLEIERRRYLEKEGRMPESDFVKVRAHEDEIEEGIEKIKEAEKYNKLVKQDMSRLSGERNAYEYRREELQNMLGNFRGMTIICIVAFAVCMVMLLILQFAFSMDTKIGYVVSILAVATAVTIFFVKYMDADRELEKVEKAENKLVLLQNKVKIRYVNNVNLLDYYYLKYEVDSAAKLQKLWNLYKEEKEARRQFAEAEANLDYYRKDLVKLLAKYRVKDPARWVTQPEALLDPKEMVEIRHDLIVRRQALRKQMDYNRKMAEEAYQEIREVAKLYPQYADEIVDMIEKAEKSMIVNE